MRAALLSPNALSYLVSTPTANLLTINQNHFDGWHLVMGHGKVVPGPGLLRVEVPAGVEQISLRYGEPYLGPGCTISLIALGGDFASYLDGQRAPEAFASS